MKNLYIIVGVGYGGYYLFNVIKDLFFSTTEKNKENNEEMLFDNIEESKPKKIVAKELEHKIEKENNQLNATDEQLQELFERTETEEQWKTQEENELRILAEMEREALIQNNENNDIVKIQKKNKSLKLDANDKVVNETSFDMSRKKSINEIINGYDSIEVEEEAELSKFLSILN